MCEITGKFHRCNNFFEKFCQEGRYGGNGVKSSSPSERREDFRAEKNQTRTDTTEGSKITLLFPSLRRLAETLRDWKRYKGQTGEWPALSIIAYAVHGIMLFSCAAFLVWFGFQHNWSKTRFLVIVLLLALPEVILWDWVQKRSR